MDKHEIEFFLAINHNGEIALSTDDAASAVVELESTFNNEAVRTYAFKLNIPLPKPVEVTVDVPETDGPVTITVA